MIKQQHQSDPISKILNKLNLKSVEEITYQQTIDISKISSTSQLHQFVVEELLNELHLLINTPHQNYTQHSYSISLQTIFPQYIHCDMSINSSEIVEVIGRGNSGKTYTINQIIKYCLTQSIHVILLTSANNSLSPHKYLTIFKFSQIAQLSILIHSIGNHLLSNKVQHKYILIIDTLTRIQHTEEPIQIERMQKLKRLLLEFSNKCCTVLYTFRTNQSLFDSSFKKELTRPRLKNSKQWDNIASKTLCIDTLFLSHNRLAVRIIQPKCISSHLQNYIIQC